MPDTAKKKVVKTPRQLEIDRLAAKGRDKRSDQDSARLDQLRQEERRDRFIRLAPKRVQNVLDSLRRLSACGQRNSYQYTADEAAKIGVAVMAAVDEVRKSFEERKNEMAKFSL